MPAGTSRRFKCELFIFVSFQDCNLVQNITQTIDSARLSGGRVVITKAKRELNIPSLTELM
jgi:hypothetical protein